MRSTLRRCLIATLCVVGLLGSAATSASAQTYWPPPGGNEFGKDVFETEHDGITWVCLIGSKDPNDAIIMCTPKAPHAACIVELAYIWDDIKKKWILDNSLLWSCPDNVPGTVQAAMLNSSETAVNRAVDEDGVLGASGVPIPTPVSRRMQGIAPRLTPAYTTVRLNPLPSSLAFPMYAPSLAATPGSGVVKTYAEVDPVRAPTATGFSHTYTVADFNVYVPPNATYTPRHLRVHFGDGRYLNITRDPDQLSSFRVTIWYGNAYEASRDVAGDGPVNQYRGITVEDLDDGSLGHYRFTYPAQPPSSGPIDEEEECAVSYGYWTGVFCA